MHFEKIGSEGPPVVLLHGWGQNLEALKPLAQCLSGAMQVYVFDLPGFGKSAAPGAVWDSFQYADHLKETMQKLGVETFSVMGHSFGGKVAMSLAMKYPKSVQNLVLMASSGLKRKRSCTNAMRFYSIRTLGKLVKRFDALFATSYFESHFIPRFGSRDYKQASQMRSILVKSVNEDFAKNFEQSSIDAPTLILWGENDQETPKEMALQLHALIPNSSYYIFPHKDHYLFQDCGSHLCAYYILSFLRGKNG